MAQRETSSAALRDLLYALRGQSGDSSLSYNDRQFLAQIMGSDAMLGSFGALDAFERGEPQPIDRNALDSFRAVLDQLDEVAVRVDAAAELYGLLASPHMRAVVEAHDDIAIKNFYPDLEPFLRAVKNVGGSKGSLGGSQASFDNTLQRMGRTPSDERMQSAAGRATLPNKKDAGSKRNVNGSIAALSSAPSNANFVPQYDAGEIRMVGILKNSNEPLGITVSKREYQDSSSSRQYVDIVIERVLAGSVIEKQDTLHSGDIIKEVNGQPVDSPEALMRIIRTAPDGTTVMLKVIPGYRERLSQSGMYLRAHFAYDPTQDSLIPSREAGLRFATGDVLQVVNQDDPYWWQAHQTAEIRSLPPPPLPKDLVLKVGRAGLVPSQSLEERRKAFAKPDFDSVQYSVFSFAPIQRHKKVKKEYLSIRSEEFDRNDMVVYEEVAPVPGFQRKTIVLVGSAGVGRRTLKEALIRERPDQFATTIASTTREPRAGEVSGKNYFFEQRVDMERDIKANKYLEWGEFGSNLYGTNLDTVRRVIATGKTCVLDCAPTALKFLRNAEFMPYIVFIAAPALDVMKAMYELGRSRGLTSKIGRNEEDFRRTIADSARLERQYKHYFDHVILNDNMETAYRELKEVVGRLSVEWQWVPVLWVY